MYISQKKVLYPWQSNAGVREAFAKGAEKLGLMYSATVYGRYNSLDDVKDWIESAGIDDDVDWSILFFYGDNPHIVLFLSDENAAMLCALSG